MRLCGTILVTFAAIWSANAFAMMEADKFFGAWRLISAEFRDEEGALAESPYGTEPQGILMYDAEGSMSAQIAGKDRQPFASSDRMSGTPDEVKGAFQSYQAYWGRYKIDEQEHTVIHTVTQALLPNWVGTQQKRHYKFQDGRLYLRTPPLLIGGKRLSGVLIWEKIKQYRE